MSGAAQFLTLLGFQALAVSLAAFEGWLLVRIVRFDREERRMR
jgi:hypothetical protein